MKKQLDEEVEHLTNSFTKLHAAQGKFKECLRCVKTGSSPSQGMRQLPSLPMCL